MKKIVPFGVFLLENALITEKDLREVLEYQRKNRVPVGEIAMAREDLTQKQVLEILAVQQESDEHPRFCEIGITQGCLTRENVDAILEHQALFRMHLGDALLELGKIECRALKDALFEYEKLVFEECPEALEGIGKKPVKVLVVDDDEMIREGIAGYLKLNEHEVEMASGAFEAIDKLEAGEFHVVITDIMMPDMDGVSLLTVARRKFLLTEIIMITGHSSEEMARRCFKNGAFGYLSKPFKTDELFKMTQEAAKHYHRKKMMILRSAPKS
ncbi:MAG: response regulator [Nitrospinae bacterium]|nr:response regulator [Nitrospinota bacterium]